MTNFEKWFAGYMLFVDVLLALICLGEYTGYIHTAF